jgi:Bacterial membrane protein YfhO
LTWLRRHPAAAAALIYAVLSVLLYAPALLPGRTLSAADYLWTAAPWSSQRPSDVRVFGSNYELIDSAVQFQPWLEYTRDRLPSAPLWNPQIAAGRPYLANAQSAILSPFSLPAYLLPFWWSLGVIGVLKAFAAAFGTYLLARALGMRFGGALLAGLVYAFCLYLLVWESWPQTNVWALAPWLWLLTERVIRAPRVLPVVGLAGVVALQFFGGHPESNFHLLAATVVFFALRLVVLRREGALPGVRRPVVGFALGVIGGTALAAVTLIPFLELLMRSSDVDVRQGFSGIALPKKYLLGFALYDYWGRATHTAVEAFAQERALYFGALPLTLAATALIVRPKLQRVGLAVFALFLLAVVLGVWPVPEIARHIPVIRSGNHLRVVFILMLCLALLAGWGLDELTERVPPRRHIVLALALGLLVLPVLILLARDDLTRHALGDALNVFANRSWPTPPPDTHGLHTIRMASLIAWLVFMGLAVLLLLARLRWRLGATAFVALACLLVVADLFKAGMGATPAIDAADAKQPSTPGIEYLRSRGLNRFVGLERALGPSPLVPDMAMRWGLYDARSYDLPVERRYDRLWRRAVHEGGPTDTPTTSVKLTEQALPALRLLSVTDIAQDPDDPRITTPALAPTYDRPDLRVYKLPGALPRAGVVSAQRVVSGDAAQLDAVLDPAFDGRRTVVTGSPLPGLGEEASAGPTGSARIIEYKPEKVVVDATARRPAELVLTDVDFPGWKVKVDGKSADLHRVDYLLRGTSLPAGRHRVEFSYEPLSFRAGWIISLIALLALAGAAGVALRRGRA